MIRKNAFNKKKMTEFKREFFASSTRDEEVKRTHRLNLFLAKGAVNDLPSMNEPLGSFMGNPKIEPSERAWAFVIGGKKK